ncbi:MAG: ribosome recycling factor [Patescibacteria group bacterium]
MPNPIDLAEPDFENALSHLEKELHAIRGGRANASVIEHIKVEAYGSTLEIKGLASISVPDAKTIQIEPWDKAVVKDIEKALSAANLGMNPSVMGAMIRLHFPPMTEENRKDTVKVVHQKGEHARIAIRNVREQVRDAILKQEKANMISEDERFRLQDILDKKVAELNTRVDATVKEKEHEILTM